MTHAGAVSALNNLMAQRLIGEHSRTIGAIMERLSTGERINRAKDDPSGVMVSARLDAEMMQMRGEMESNDALLHKLAVTDGYYSVLAELTIDLEATVVAASAGDAISQGEREALQVEADGIIQAIDHLYQTAVFKGERLLGEGLDINSGGSYRRLELTDFADLGRTYVELEPPSDPVVVPPDEGMAPDAEPAPEAASPWASIADIRSGGRLNLVDGDLEAAFKVASAARKGVAEQWAAIGTQMKGVEGRNRLLAVQLEGNRAASSALTDADFAQETSALVREQVLQQASIFVLQTSQRMHQRTLGLLFGSAA